MKIDVSRLCDESYEDELMGDDCFVKLTKKAKAVNKRKDDVIKLKRRQKQAEKDELERVSSK